MASSGPFPFDNSHRQRHSVSHSPSNRRPSTSPTPTRPLPSSSSPLVFLYDSPPIPGDPDYLGEDLFVPVRRNRNSNHNRDTGTRGIGTGIRTEIDQTAETLPSTAATTTAAVAGNINNSNSGTTLTTSPSTTSHPSASQPLASLLPRPRSAGGNRNDLNTPVYSTSTSARTSYTRVDLTAMEPSVNLESHVASGQAERRDENGGSEAGREGGGVEESLPSSSLLAVTTTTTTTTSELTQQQQSQPQEEGNFNSSAQQQPTPSTPIPQTPQVALCFLLISGKRRVMQFEPETTVGRVKELVWNAWPSDWQDEQPPTPWHLRLLYLGKILQDDDTLKGKWP
ncbi:hypothetical protein L218DRAFT_452515 [Marasmius fiardii PR-910]|nr:hypothetical protein L218DRAFT_452515 [Marasmius fiardii PR-910]